MVGVLAVARLRRAPRSTDVGRLAGPRIAGWILAAAALGGLALAPLGRQQPVLFAATLAVTLTFAAAGALVWDEPGQRPAAAAFGIAALLWSASWLNEWRVGPLPLLSTLDDPLPILVAGWALMRYPRRWLRPAHERAVVIAFVAVELSVFPQVLTSRPGWHDFRSDAIWLTVWPSRSAYHAASVGYEAAGLAAAVGFGALLTIQAARLRGPDQLAVAPLAWATVAACCALTVSSTAWLLTSSPDVKYVFSDVEAAVLVGVPVALLVTVVRRRLGGETVARLAARLGEQPDVETVRAAARDALRDPSAEIWYWLPADRAWVDSDGRAGSPRGPGRFVHEIGAAGGDPLAAVAGDESLAHHRPLVGLAAQAIALVLENARLQAAIRAETRRVGLSADRVERAVGAEKRQVERAIRDGVTRRLVHLDETLRLLVARTEGTEAGDALAEARRLLAGSRRELDLLAGGQVPPELAQAGLRTAVAIIATGHLVPLEVDVPAERLGVALERAVYFVVAEAVSNAVKHAKADRVTVRVTLGEAVVTAEVRDDGRGGADPCGSGLAGVARRVRALGGTFAVDSWPGAGTCVRAQLPLPPVFGPRPRPPLRPLSPPGHKKITPD